MGRLETLGILFGITVQGAVADAAGSPALTCSVGATTVRVTTSAGKFVYRHGYRHRTDITVAENPQAQNVLRFEDRGARWELTTLRFVNGGYGYVVFNFFRAGPDGAEQFGFATFKGRTLLSRHLCRSVVGDLPLEGTLARLPEDPFGSAYFDTLMP